MGTVGTEGLHWAGAGPWSWVSLECCMTAGAGRHQARNPGRMRCGVSHGSGDRRGKETPDLFREPGAAGKGRANTTLAGPRRPSRGWARMPTLMHRALPHPLFSGPRRAHLATRESVCLCSSPSSTFLDKANKFKVSEMYKLKSHVIEKKESRH